MAPQTHPLRVGILGAGAIALGTAAWLARAGHGPMLWSPSGKRTRALAAGAPLQVRGAFVGAWPVRIAHSCAEAVEQADVVLLAAPGYAHRALLDAAAPHLRAHQPFIFSSHSSFAALYLSQALARRGVRASLIAWSTTLVTGRVESATEVDISTVRDRVDMATLPAGDAEAGLRLCETLFDPRFKSCDGLLAIALSNLNPQNHLAIALLNLTRMERGERWYQSQNVTPSVGRLIETLDAERCAIAAAFGRSVRTASEHFSLSFHVAPGSVSAMNQAMFENGNRTLGPSTAASRYVLEDVPFGLVPTAWLGHLCDRPAPLHEAGIALLSAAYGRDFAHDNDLLPRLHLPEAGRRHALEQLCETGYALSA